MGFHELSIQIDVNTIFGVRNDGSRKPGLKRRAVYQGRSTLQLHSMVEWSDFRHRCKTYSDLESFHSNKSCLNSKKYILRIYEREFLQYRICLYF